MKFASRVATTMQSGLDELFTAPDPELISFAGGYPDATMFPQAALQGAFAQATEESAAFQYGDSWGLPRLRRHIAQWLQKDGIPATAQDVLLTQGAQQGIDLAAKMLLNPGDGLVVEAPTYLGALAAFNAYEPQYYEVPMAADGMDLGALQKILMTHKIKMIYTVPDFQNPTGAVMSLAIRKALIALANQYDVIILEDGPYRWLRYQGESLPPLKHFDTQGRVIFLGSMSKILAPSLRLGWMVAAPKLLEAAAALRGASDVESSQLVHRAVALYLEQNDFDAHLDQLRQCYGAKLKLMHHAISAQLPAGYQLSQPAGGFFLWLTAPAGVDMTALQAQRLAPAHVSVVPSKNLTPSHQLLNGARLTFAAPPTAKIEPGSARLTAALAATATAQAHRA